MSNDPESSCRSSKLTVQIVSQNIQRGFPNLSDNVFSSYFTAFHSKDLATSTASTGLVLKTSTGWQTRERTSCWSRWRTGVAGKCLQSTPASEWSLKLITTDWEWAAIMAMLATRSLGITANSLQHWTEIVMHTQVKQAASQKIQLLLCLCLTVVMLKYFLRKLCSLSEGRLVVQLMCPFKPKWSLVQRRTLPQPLPRWNLLGRV